MDEILRRAIKAIADDLPEETRAELRKRAHGLTLQQQLDLVTEEAMKNWMPHDFSRLRKELEKEVRG